MNARKIALLAAAGLLVASRAAAADAQPQDRSSMPSTEKQQQAAGDQIEKDQAQSAKLLDEAKDAQEDAADQQKKAADAREDVREQEQKLSEAREKEQKETRKAQQLQQQANEKAQQAQQGAQQAQQRATRGQQQVAQESQRTSQETQAREGQAAASAQASAQPQGGKTLDGKVTRVGKDELTLQTSGGESTKLKVNASTQVTVDGQQKSIGELQQGAQVRASYDERGGDKTATRIEAKDARSGSPSAPQTESTTK